MAFEPLDLGNEAQQEGRFTSRQPYTRSLFPLYFTILPQQTLRELLLQLPQPGLGTISADYGPAATCRSMDLAAAAGARATRKSRLWAGDAAGGRGPERRHATGPTTTRPQGAGRRVSPGARDSESSASQLDAACAGYLLF